MSTPNTLDLLTKEWKEELLDIADMIEQVECRPLHAKDESIAVLSEYVNRLIQQAKRQGFMGLHQLLKDVFAGIRSRNMVSAYITIEIFLEPPSECDI